MDWLTDEELNEARRRYALAGAVDLPEWAAWIIGLLAGIGLSAVAPGSWW
jgi:hypothetical protein